MKKTHKNYIKLQKRFHRLSRPSTLSFRRGRWWGGYVHRLSPLSLPHQVSIISGEDCDSLTTTIFLCRRCLLTPTRYLGDNSGTGPSLEAVSVA